MGYLNRRGWIPVSRLNLDIGIHINLKLCGLDSNLQFFLTMYFEINFQSPEFLFILNAYEFQSLELRVIFQNFYKVCE